MQLARKQDLSIYYWLIDKLPNFVTVEDGFPEGDLTLPTVSVEHVKITGKSLQLGGTERDHRIWRIDVFAENKSQRDDYAYLLYSEMESGIPVYDYDEGFPPPTPTQLGVLITSGRETQPLKVFEDLARLLHWRSVINFRTEYQTI